MREKQNTYLFTAGILVFAFFFMPLTKFDDTKEVFTIIDFMLPAYMMGAVYKYFVGAALNGLLAALIFAAVTVHRNKVWQERLVKASLALNILLLGFITYKYCTWEFYPKHQSAKPALQFGIIFPLLVEMMLAGALQKLRRD